MKKNIDYYKNLKFSYLSGDENKIHLNKSFAKDYFFKKPVVHGVHLALIGITKYLNKNTNLLIKNIEIQFRNFCLVNESFKINIKKKNININGLFEPKIQILVLSQENILKRNVIKKNYKYFFNLKNNNNNNFYEHLLYVSYFIGTVKPGNGALIHFLKTKKDNTFRKNKMPLVKKIIKNVFSIIIFYKGFVSEINCSKSQPLLNYGKKLKLSNNILKKIQNKKIFMIGSSSEIGDYLSKFFVKNNIKILKYNFKITNKQNLKREVKKIKKTIINYKPDYLFYFSSPKIVHDYVLKKKLFYSYNLVYCIFFKNILDILKKSNLNTKVFYPSSIFLNKLENKNYLKSYIKAKRKAEIICKKHPYRKLVKLYRLPKLKTKTNYNILGYYEGSELSCLSKYLSNFFS